MSCRHDVYEACVCLKTKETYKESSTIQEMTQCACCTWAWKTRACTSTSDSVFLSLDRWMHPPIFYHRWFTLYFGSLQKKMKMLSFQFMEVFSKNSEHNNLSLKCVTALVKEKGVPNCKWFQIGQPFWLSSLSNFLLFLHWVAFFSYLLWLWLLVRRLQLLPRRHEIILKEIKWKYLYS